MSPQSDHLTPGSSSNMPSLDSTRNPSPSSTLNSDVAPIVTPNVINSSSPRAQASLHLASDPTIQAGFDARVEIDRGRESSNGGYLASNFDSSELNPPLAPGSHRYVGPHEPLDFDKIMNTPEGGRNADN